ncbi:hypothetical protein [Zhongshania borealis]|uniref:hypothetical protein n=1 Tax=Zhongshania borealis TaxID=889488 RepID=UPI0031E5BBF5
MNKLFGALVERGQDPRHQEQRSQELGAVLHRGKLLITVAEHMKQLPDRTLFNERV